MVERSTRCYAIARGMSNVWKVEVTGNLGSFNGIRKTLAEARSTAHNYAVLLDAPHQVI